VSFSAPGAGPLTTGASAQTSRRFTGWYTRWFTGCGSVTTTPTSRATSIRWIVIHEEPITATFYVGKTDCGQGTGTSFRQVDVR